MSFQQALAFALHWEGGYSNIPGDLGHATNKGVTQDVYDHYRDSHSLPRQSVRHIEDTEVSEIYQKQYWNPFDSWNLDDKLHFAVFDDAINMGVARAARLLLASGKDVVKFCHLRELLYERFATVPSQHKFLEGWLNRLNALKKELGISEE